MREFTADRYENGVLVCFDVGGSRLDLPCPRPDRPEGRRVLVSDAIAASSPYVSVAGSVPTADGRRALIFAPDEKHLAAVRERFGGIFKKALDKDRLR